MTDPSPDKTRRQSTPDKIRRQSTPATRRQESTEVRSRAASSIYPDDIGPLTFESSFRAYSSYGEKDRTNFDTITLKNIDKWLKQCAIPVTPADTAITFSKIARQEKRLSIRGMDEFLTTLADQKNEDVVDWKAKMTNAGPPRSSVPRPSITGMAALVTDRLTDISGYTGIHKGKFDESGKAVAIEERDDIVQDDGYVQGYTNKDTYDEKKQK